MLKIFIVLLLSAVLVLTPACECNGSVELHSAAVHTEITVPLIQEQQVTDNMIETESKSHPAAAPIMKYYTVPLDADMQEYIHRVAGNYGIEYKLVLAVIMTESSGNPDAIGDGGQAIGLMQIQPRWWQELIDYWKLDIYQPEDNVRLGVMILSECLLENGGDVRRALKQYNSGNPDYSSDTYYEKVMEHMNKLQEVN